jgi:flagellar hook assembly protein FlgD
MFDASGRQVAALSDGTQNSGRHIKTWDGRAGSGQDLPNGVYFARLEFGGHVETRKVVLAR